MSFLRLLPLVLCAPLLSASPECAACDYPDEGTMPLHRAITRVKLLPETEAWSAAMLRNKVMVQYGLFLEPSVLVRGRCYWTVEARAGGSVWRRFYVSPDGRSVLSETGDRLPVVGR